MELRYLVQVLKCFLVMKPQIRPHTTYMDNLLSLNV